MSILCKPFIIIALLAGSVSGLAQNRITIKGSVSDSTGFALEYVTISLPGPNQGTLSDQNGLFSIQTSTRTKIILQFSRLNYEPREVIVKPVDYPGQDTIEINVRMKQMIQNIDEVVVKGMRDQTGNLVRLDPRIIKIMPDASGSFEGIIKSQLGVTSSNELSSQYSVRGGNFDENLVYVNDIEVYRPFLIRAGQQEGLSFINADMVSSVLFSAGGFDARYGDKMSSVLDIRYKQPSAFAGSASASLMGGSLHLEGASKDRRLSHISGFRYKTNRYLLSSLDTRGDYNPSFADFQTYISFDLSTDWEIDFLGNIAHNSYLFIPEDRETSFGTVNEALQLKIYFDGMERDAFTTMLGAFSTRYHPSEKFELKFIASAFTTNEQETFDIQGQYRLNELDKRLNSDNFADSILNIGVGTFLDHARNKLKANVLSLSHKGTLIDEQNQISWGLKYQYSMITDHIEEWVMMDSAGYSLPYSDTLVNLQTTHFAQSDLHHTMVTGYYQDNYQFQLESGTLTLTGGIRGSYQDINKAYTISPRMSLAYQPEWEEDWTFRFSGGAYHQPPFFKEFRDLNGSLNPNVQAQKSVHIVAGSDFYFTAWNRPFKFTTEAYYKYLWDLIPYEINNVRIRYYGDNSSDGYATGVDFKVNGEFVPGVDSWASVSIMKTQEDIRGDTIGFIDRPSDQRVNVALFFQDFIPNNRSYKAHLNLLFGTGMPYGPPGNTLLKSALKIPPYRRVDLGFSKVLISKKGNSKLPKWMRPLYNTWVSLEVFNLLDINNTISHIWIRDISNRQYSIPNYLTGRRINVKLQTSF